MPKRNWILAVGAVLLLGSSKALGASDYSDGIPEFVYWQIANFAVFAVLMYVLLRKRVPEFFKAKREAFVAHERKARQEKDEALRAKKSVQDQIDRLTTGREEGLTRAAEEGQAFAARMKQESQALKLRLQEELKRTEAVEMEKVAFSVRSLLIDRSVEGAREAVKRDLVEADDKRLQIEFIEKFQVVS